MADINTVLNNFLAEQGFNDLTATYEKDSDCYYYYAENKVVLGGLTNNFADKIFMDYCKELGLKVPVGIEVLSFLHEVGHHVTIDFLDEDELINSEMTKILLCVRDDDDYTEEEYRAYMSCPVEYEATLDAVNFCNANPEVVMQLNKNILISLYE